jgi:phospholipid/cholesterol/gamma-HCH transport system ATP-binding protein
LLKTLVGLLPPLGGTIEILGKNPFDLDEHEHAELLRRTGMMFQHGALFGSQTVYENISMPLREHTDVPEPVIEEMVRMKLALVGLRGLENRLPSDISGGQRKRVALVRASILDPDIVFADEPSAGLDPIAAAGLDRVLRRFQDLFNMTLVVVTHELDSIEILADRVVMLEDGNVVTTGTVEELRNSEIESVRNFFQRNPPEYLESGKGASVWTELQS